MRDAQISRWTPEDVASSYALWWREAGLVDATSPEAHGWRTGLAPSPPTNAQPQTDLRPLPGQDAIPETAALRAPAASSPAPAAARAMPDDLVAFRSWLADDPAQPETRWSGPLCLPPAIAQARLLILSDMPDEGIEDTQSPFAPPRTRFLSAMLSALGLAPDDVAFAPLAMRRPPGGLLDETASAALAARMQHYLALATPRAALILGDRTSRALIGVQGAPAPNRLHKINLSKGSVITAALASPDHLMRRPSAKAASWQTLRLLNGVIAA